MNNNVNIDTKKNINQHQYGLLSMLALIVGTVIGSGIYIVNDKLYTNAESSTGLAMISWVLISLIVFFMLISFMEIASITKKTGEAGTINNWTRHLWNDKTAKYFGIYFPLIYFPILLSGFSMIMVGELFSNIDKFQTIDNTNEMWSEYGYSIVIGVTIISLVFLMNALSMKPGKLLQTSGTIIKLIPLFTLVFIGILLIFGAFGSNVTETNNVFQIKPQTGDEFNSNIFIIILLLTPTVMFSYDGFLFAASLQNESKKPSTYKTAAVSGIVFIICTYLLVAIFSFKYGDPTASNGFSVSLVIGNIFPNSSSWLIPLVSAMIIISVITGLSGLSIAENRMVADLSAHNEIRDPNGNLIARNKALVPQGAAIFTWFFTISVFIILRGFDGIALWSYGKTYGGDPNQFAANFNYFPVHSWSLDYLTLISYCFYVFIIIGAIKNRFTNDVEVDKNKAFLPSAFLATIVITVILGVFTYNIFSPPDFSAENNQYQVATYILQISLAILIIAEIILLPWIFDRGLKKATDEEKKKKNEIIKAYKERQVDPRYIRN